MINRTIGSIVIGLIILAVLALIIWLLANYFDKVIHFFLIVIIILICYLFGELFKELFLR